MQVESLPIEALIFDPSNARLHDNKNLDAIKGSLTKFGQRTPIVCDEKNLILKGNGTAAAAKALGWDKLYVIRVNDLSEVQKSAYAIADNRTGELARWDGDVLTKTLLALQAEDFKLDDIGFSDLDLKKLFGDLHMESPDYSVLGDDAPNLDNLKGGVRKAIQIEFDLDSYQEAVELVKFCRGKEIDVGVELIECLRQIKEAHEDQ